jgi:hypothetical protein
MKYNRMRIALTGFSIGWGIFLLIVMLGSGNGVLHGITNGFVTSTENVVTVTPSSTSVAYGSSQKGRTVTLTDADCEKMQEGSTQEVLDYNEPLIKKAFELTNVVNKRSICKKELAANDTLQLNTGATKAQMSELVKRERQRELMYEGKRWYDLVRYAMRAGNTNEIISATSKRDDVNAGFVANFFKKMDAIFWPYNLEELKVNRNLVPNPAFSSGENESMDKS